MTVGLPSAEGMRAGSPAAWLHLDEVKLRLVAPQRPVASSPRFSVRPDVLAASAGLLVRPLSSGDGASRDRLLPPER